MAIKPAFMKSEVLAMAAYLLKGTTSFMPFEAFIAFKVFKVNKAIAP